MRLAGQLIGQGAMLGVMWIFNLLIWGIRSLIPFGKQGLPLTLNTFLITVAACLAFLLLQPDPGFAISPG